MTEIIGKIAAILGFRRYGKVLERNRKKPGRTRSENDTITISDEARRLSVSGTEEEPLADKEGKE